MKTENIKNRMQQLLQYMNHGVYERQEVTALAMLSAIAGESIFLLGLPGVGKSMVARRLKMAFSGATSFEYLMSRFSTPDEIFGPVSITKLKDCDTYERVIDGYLPTADIVFLDEIWKAGPAIQNSLLTALNEKIFHNGSHDIQLPLKTVISASNELPAEGEGLEALWDRFLIRYVVEPIHNRGSFVRLITENGEDCNIPEELTITDNEFREWKDKIKSVNIPEVVCNIICDLRDILSDNSRLKIIMPANEPPYVSDRRWRKIMGILRTSAFLNGRSSVNVSDCLLLEHLLWDNDVQILPVKRMIEECIATRISSDIARSISVDELEGKSFAEPVSDFLCKNGKYYVFEAGGEEIMIDKAEYENLTGKTYFGDITADNVLHIAKGSGMFTVKAPIKGSIVLNTFTYKLKHETPLRTGSTDEFVRTLNSNTDVLEAKTHELIDDNLFLRPFDSYKNLQRVFEELRYNKKDVVRQANS